MMTEDLVRDVNDKLEALKKKAISVKADPMFVELIHQMMRVTNVDNAKTISETAGGLDVVQTEGQSHDEHYLGRGVTHQTAAPPESGFRKPSAAADCAHQNQDPFGRCKDCGQCQHIKVVGGTCITCDAAVDAA